jgi:hypothetical protein
MASPANGIALPKFIDPAGLQAITHYLVAFEAHLEDPSANREPSPTPLLRNTAHGCIKAVYSVPYSVDFAMFGVSLGTEWLHLVRPIDFAGLGLVTAFGLELGDDHLDHGMERFAVRAAALEWFDAHARDYPFPKSNDNYAGMLDAADPDHALPFSRDQYAAWLDLAFTLGDRAYGVDSVDGRLFPDTVDHAAEAAR